jgi:hypothetical protein
MRLAATRQQFECEWPPVACYFCIQLAATREQFECDWPPIVWYFCMRLTAALKKSLIAGDEQMLSSFTTESVLKNILYTTQISEFFDESVNWIL